MIVAVGFGNIEGDTPSIFVVDTEKCTKEWQRAIFSNVNGVYSELPSEWESLKDAKVSLPIMVEAAVFIYYKS